MKTEFERPIVTDEYAPKPLKSIRDSKRKRITLETIEQARTASKNLPLEGYLPGRFGEFGN